MICTIQGCLRFGLAVFLSSLLLACSDSNNSNNLSSSPDPDPTPPDPEPELTYEAEVIRTEYGIPHIIADDWGSLGYGTGYSYARENFCTLMRAYVQAKGESARYFGDEGDLSSDLVMKWANSDERINRLINEALPAYIVENLTGYAAGVNRYLNETGVDNLAEGEEGCRGAEWVREVDLMDAVRVIHRTILRASTLPLADFTTAVTGPDETVTRFVLPPGDSTEESLIASLDKDSLQQAIGLPRAEEMGSNAYAVGEQASQSDSGVLLGNPHFPWTGQLRFFMFHLTLGEEYNVMGSALGGLPAPVIAFNSNVAWSHTVSTGSRFTFYELELNPENPLQYFYDGELRDIESLMVSAERMLEDGSIETVEQTLYFSQFGPIVDLGEVNPFLAGWPNAVGTLLTYRDANLENLRGLDMWIKMGQAEDLTQFKEALHTVGNPWTNTIAADRYGDALYGDISVVPHVTGAKYNNCIRGTLQTLLTDFGFLTMDGSDSACEWGSDPDTAEGIFGYDSLPKLETREYGANANDSYWLPNPRMLLEGFPPIIGQERVEQTLRTRATFDQAENRLAGTDEYGDPGFNIDNIRQLHYQALNYTGQLVADDVVAVCSAVEDWSSYTEDASTVEQACEVLGDWDRAHRVDSVGGHVFWEFWQRVRGTENLWAVPFDAADPVNTPRDLNVGDADVVEAVKQALADGVARLVEAGIPMDRPWGEVQFAEKNGERYGIHGASGSMVFSAISSGLVDGEGYSDITTGNSYIHAVTWDESDCPDAYAILTYSQSTDPASPHYADSTQLYSEGGWIDMPYCEADRDAQEISRETISE